MNIPFGNLMNFMNQYQQFMATRDQFLSQLPSGMGNDPNQIIQNMMNSGKISQNQFNNAKSMADYINRMSRH